MKIKKEDFARQVKHQIEKDIDEITQRLADFTDNNIIAHKFEAGFPGHELQPTTIKKKGNDRVGIKSGALLRAATAFTTWSLYPASVGGQRPAAIKRKNGLTAYSNFVKTKIGGELDFLSITPEEITNLQSKIKQFFSQKNYKGNGRLRIVRKEV